MPLLKLGKLYVNSDEIREYSAESGVITYKNNVQTLLTEPQSDILNWFLDAVKGPQMGVFDATDLFNNRHEIAARYKEQTAVREQVAGEIEDTEAGLPEIENAIETLQANATSLGKTLSPAQIAEARKILARKRKVLPISDRKN